MDTQLDLHHWLLFLQTLFYNDMNAYKRKKVLRGTQPSKPWGIAADPNGGALAAGSIVLLHMQNFHTHRNGASAAAATTESSYEPPSKADYPIGRSSPREP